MYLSSDFIPSILCFTVILLLSLIRVTQPVDPGQQHFPERSSSSYHLTDTSAQRKEEEKIGTEQDTLVCLSGEFFNNEVINR